MEIFGCLLFYILFFAKMIPECFSNVAVWTLGFYCNGSVFGIIVLQENEAIAVKCFPDDITWGIKKFGSALVCLKFSFDKIPQHHLLKYSPKPGQSLHHVL